MEALNNLPVELNYRILLELPLPDLLRTCQTSTLYNSICSLDVFWRDKIIHDYGDVDFDNSNPRQAYLRLYRSKSLPVYVQLVYKGDKHYIGHIRVYEDNTVGDVFDHTIELFNDTFTNRLDLVGDVGLYDRSDKELINNAVMNRFGLNDSISEYKNLAYILIQLWGFKYTKYSDQLSLTYRDGRGTLNSNRNLNSKPNNNLLSINNMYVPSDNSAFAHEYQNRGHISRYYTQDDNVPMNNINIYGLPYYQPLNLGTDFDGDEYSFNPIQYGGNQRYKHVSIEDLD